MKIPFEKKVPANRKNWKAELELEQLRRALELEQENSEKERKETD